MDAAGQGTEEQFLVCAVYKHYETIGPFFLSVKIGLKEEPLPVFLLLHLTQRFQHAVHLLYALPFPTFIIVIA